MCLWIEAWGEWRVGLWLWMWRGEAKACGEWRVRLWLSIEVWGDWRLLIWRGEAEACGEWRVGLCLWIEAWDEWWGGLEVWLGEWVLHNWASGRDFKIGGDFSTDSLSGCSNGSPPLL